jgi:ArsR family transcriptional regulator
MSQPASSPASIVPTAFFAALANDTRLRMLMLLLREGELCVCELTGAIGVSQPHISRHLAQLRELALVADRRAGTWIYYRIHPDLPPWAKAILRETVAGLRGAAPFDDDQRALTALANRPDAPRCGAAVD